MTNFPEDMIKVRYHAIELAESMVVAYWINRSDKKYHIDRAINSFKKVADLMGYDIKEREINVTAEAAE